MTESEARCSGKTKEMKKYLSMSKFGLYGKLKAQRGKGSELADILSEAASLVSTAKGCQLYIVNRDQADPDCVWITEVWDSEADHSASLKMEGVGTLISRAMPFLDGQPEQIKLDVIGGKGI